MEDNQLSTSEILQRALRVHPEFIVVGEIKDKEEIESLLKSMVSTNNIEAKRYVYLQENRIYHKEIKIELCKRTCYGYPTVFEFKDVEGNEYYFRLRHGYARIVNEISGEVIIEGSMGDLDGVCNWDDVVAWAKEHTLILSRV